MNLILRKEKLTNEDALKYYPDNSLTNEQGYQHYVQVYAFTPFNKKTFTGVAIEIIGEREQGNMIITNMCMNIPCGKAYLDKPLRQSAREELYKQAKTKLLEQALRVLDVNHPYVKTLEAM